MSFAMYNIITVRYLLLNLYPSTTLGMTFVFYDQISDALITFLQIQSRKKDLCYLTIIFWPKYNNF